MQKLSRRRIAAYIATELARTPGAAKRTTIVAQLAAYIIASKTERQWQLYAADIERELAGRGMVYADVTTARPLSDELRLQVTSLLQKRYDAPSVALREHVDTTVIGGIRLETATEVLDATVAERLRTLKTMAV